MKNKRSEIERRLRLMAKAKVDMLQGIYVFANGRPPLNPDGTPKISDRELLRVGGYTETYKDYKTKLFGDPYFVTQVRTEMARREKAVGFLAVPTVNSLTKIRDLLRKELEVRLETAPHTFSNQQLLQMAKEYDEHVDRHDPATKAPKSNEMMNQFNAFISRNVTVMTQTDRERLVTTASDAADERTAQLQQLIDQANATEEDADDADVIDAEISPEPD